MNTVLKYELLQDQTLKTLSGRTLYRIRALRTIKGIVEKGQTGGYIESEANLSQEGDAWVYDNAEVYGNARVYGDAWVYGSARAYGNVRIYDRAQVYGDAWVCGSAWVYGSARVYGNVRISGDARVSGGAWILDSAWVCKDAQVSGEVEVSGNARLFDGAQITAQRDYVCFSNVGSEDGKLTIYRDGEDTAMARRGCFTGTLDAFLAAVQKKHGSSATAREYRLMVEIACSRIGIPLPLALQAA